MREGLMCQQEKAPVAKLPAPFFVCADANVTFAPRMMLMRVVIGPCVDLARFEAYPRPVFAGMGPAEQTSETDAQFDLQGN
jgi:hypothetical protein